VVVAVAVRRLAELELVAQQEIAENRLQLHQRERRAHAAVATRAERDPRHHVAVLFASLGITRRVEAVGVGEHLGHPVRDRGRDRDQLARRHGVAVVVEVVDDLAHQDDQRRVQTQRLLDPGLELGDLAQRLELTSRPSA
jgi:hypothetical protein